MKRFFFRSIFVVSVLILGLILIVGAMAGFEILLPPRPGPDGLYRSPDRMGPTVLACFGCLWVANRIVGSLFRLVRITDERWSIFQSVRRG